MPDRRVMIVLGSLVAAMTAASALLLALEPTSARPFSAVRLSSVETDHDPQTMLFATNSPIEPDRWRGIVIHDSNTVGGSASAIAEAAGTQPYHFVIANGRGDTDGQINISNRWLTQFDGAFAGDSANSDWLNHRTIGICVIGDLADQKMTEAQQAQLVWLVRKLQAKLAISGEHVHWPAERFFPEAGFRRQLLRAAAP